MKIFKKIFGFGVEKVNTPTVLQMEAVECGAASLAMVMAYHKLFVPLEQIRVDCGVSRDGSKASNLLKAAEKYGFEASGFRKDPDDLDDIPLPAIVHWNFNHFVVLESRIGKEVYLNDPAMGKRKVTAEEFDQSFTGIILTFEPTKDFKPSGAPKSTFNAVMGRFLGVKSSIVYLSAIGLFMILPGLVMPTFSQIIIDDIIVKKMTGWLVPVLFGMVLTGIVNMILNWINDYYYSRLTNKLDTISSSKFIWHVFRLPIPFFDQRYAGDVVSRIDINADVAEFVSSFFVSFIVNSVTAVFYLTLMVQYSIVLTCVGIGTSALHMILVSWQSSSGSTASQQMLQDSGKLSSTSMSGIRMIESIKSGGGEVGFFQKWSGYHAKMLNAEQKISSKAVILRSIPSILGSISNVLILCIGGYEVLRGRMSIGMLIAFQTLIGGFMGPVSTLIGLAGSLRGMGASIDRLDDVQNYKAEEGIDFNTEDTLSGVESTGIDRLSGYLEIKDLSFGYSALDPPLIEAFHLSLNPGSRVALVGMSGSGKSTVTKVVSGLYKQWGGEILFDGKSRIELPRSVLTSSISVVDQERTMFGGTVRENISMWDTTISDNDIVEAAKDACIHDDVMERKEGYDYIIPEGGGGFSGGQIQRIQIARALAMNPSIMVMDEATSALDTKTEFIIDGNIRRRGCTCIIIAHRLSTIRDADEIIVLEKGKIVERGTHETLKNLGGYYTKLITTT